MFQFIIISDEKGEMKDEKKMSKIIAIFIHILLEIMSLLQVID